MPIGSEEDKAETNHGCQLTFKLYDPKLKIYECVSWRASALQTAIVHTLSRHHKLFLFHLLLISACKPYPLTDFL